MGDTLPVSEVSTKWLTFWDQLTKKRSGFSFNRSVPIIQYIDDAMKEEWGEPSEDNWTIANLHSVRKKIKNKILSEMND